MMGRNKAFEASDYLCSQQIMKASHHQSRQLIDNCYLLNAVYSGSQYNSELQPVKVTNDEANISSLDTAVKVTKQKFLFRLAITAVYTVSQWSFVVCLMVISMFCLRRFSLGFVVLR